MTEEEQEAYYKKLSLRANVKPDDTLHTALMKIVRWSFNEKNDNRCAATANEIIDLLHERGIDTTEHATTPTT